MPFIFDDEKRPVPGKIQGVKEFTYFGASIYKS